MTRWHSRRLASSCAALAVLTLRRHGVRRRRTPGERPEPRAGAGAIKEGLKIAFLPKQVNNPYFDTSDNGRQGRRRGVQGRVQRDRPVRGQRRRPRSATSTRCPSRVDVIVVSANDKNAICGALNEARQAGAKVVTYDSDTNPTAATCSSTRPPPRASPSPRSS